MFLTDQVALCLFRFFYWSLEGDRHNTVLSHLVASYYTLSFPDSSIGKESACNAGDLGSIPGLGRSPGEGKGYPLQYSGLENSRDCIVHGVAKSQTGLSNFLSSLLHITGTFFL